MMAVVKDDQRCPSVLCAGEASMGWLGLVLARDPGLTEVIGWLGYLDPASVHTKSGEGT